jgi:glyoxylase-like metal-dependent hydrolase (beta-lactamase superfamily II)
MPFGWNSFLSTLRAENIALDEIKYIFVTHTHTDHVGFLAKLVGATNAKIIGIPETFVRLKAGEVPRSPSRASIGAMAGLMAKAMAKGGRKSQQFEAVDVPDRQLVYDGSDDFLAKLGIPGKLLVLNGHTSDSIGILLDDGRLFCGDAAGNGFPGIERHAVFVESLDDYLKSWDVMIESGAKTIYPGHGLKFPVSDLVKYRHSLDGKQLAPFPEFSD